MLSTTRMDDPQDGECGLRAGLPSLLRDPRVRGEEKRAAIARVTDEELLGEVALRASEDIEIRRSALARMENPLQLHVLMAMLASDDELREAVVEHIRAVSATSG